jgi:hypothetical protein
MRNLEDYSKLRLQERNQPFYLAGFLVDWACQHKQERLYCAQGKRLHVNRAFGGDCYHCVIDGDIDAGTAAGQETGKGGCLSVEPAPVSHYL